MHEESLYAERVLRAGASGYITKHQGPGEVVEAVRRVLGGEVYVSDKMASEFLRSFSTGGPKSTPHSVDRLTDRELAVLELIGKGRTTREIAATLKLGVATIDTYRARIKEKMNFNNAAELLHFAIRWVRDRE
jgi:DNA-binding NarL/FixJ family response regulator